MFTNFQNSWFFPQNCLRNEYIRRFNFLFQYSSILPCTLELLHVPLYPTDKSTFCIYLQEHGLKVYLRNPSSYTPLRRAAWKDGKARSLTLGSDEQENFRQISQFSEKDAQVVTLMHDNVERHFRFTIYFI